MRINIYMMEQALEYVRDVVGCEVGDGLGGDNTLEEF